MLSRMRDAWSPDGSMPRCVPLLALGVPVVVDVWGEDAADVETSMAEPWAWCKGSWIEHSPVAESAVRVRAVADPSVEVITAAQGRGMVAASSLADLHHQLTSAVTVAAIEARAGELWMLHAACVAHPVTGSAVALVAPSGTGKTTAATVLGRRFAYLSDETTAVAASGEVVPYPKPLSIKHDDERVKSQASPGSLGLVRCDVPARLRAVVLLRRDGTAPARLTPMTVGQALPRLAEQTSYVGAFERPLATMVELLAATDGVFEASYAEAEELIDLIAGLVGEP